MQKNSYSYNELIDCGKGILFGKGNAKLPLPPMLMFDRITEINQDAGKFKKGLIKAELDILVNNNSFNSRLSIIFISPSRLAKPIKQVI